jgi:hypothetical protein
MLMRTISIGVLAGAAMMNAQPPGRGAGGGPGGARFLGFQPGMPGRTVKNAPYSADIVTETAQVLADGNRIRQSSTSKFYRDSEGRTRREQSLDSLNRLAPNSNLPQVVFISDPVAGADYALNPSSKTATRSPRMRADARAERGPGRGLEPRTPGGRGRAGNDPNVKSESLGRQLIEGVPADGTRTTMTIPAGRIGNDQAIQIVSETWYSPELQTMVLSKRSDPRNGETTVKLTNISRAEPPRTLFDVPVDFKLSEMSRPGRGPRQ